MTLPHQQYATNPVDKSDKIPNSLNGWIFSQDGANFGDRGAIDTVIGASRPVLVQWVAKDSIEFGRQVDVLTSNPQHQNTFDPEAINILKERINSQKSS